MTPLSFYTLGTDKLVCVRLSSRRRLRMNEIISSVHGEPVESSRRSLCHLFILKFLVLNTTFGYFSHVERRDSSLYNRNFEILKSALKNTGANNRSPLCKLLLSLDFLQGYFSYFFLTFTVTVSLKPSASNLTFALPVFFVAVMVNVA